MWVVDPKWYYKMPYLQFRLIFSLPEQRSRSAIVLPPASALALGAVAVPTSVKVLR